MARRRGSTASTSTAELLEAERDVAPRMLKRTRSNATSTSTSSATRHTTRTTSQNTASFFDDDDGEEEEEEDEDEESIPLRTRLPTKRVKREEVDAAEFAPRPTRSKPASSHSRAAIQLQPSLPRSRAPKRARYPLQPTIVEDDPNVEELIPLPRHRITTSPLSTLSPSPAPVELDVDASSSTAFASSSVPEPPKPRSPPPASALLPEALMCPICMCPPNDATITPCGHVMCGECLFMSVAGGMQRVRASMHGREEPQCPVCRAKIDGWDGKGGGVIGLYIKTVEVL